MIRSLFAVALAWNGVVVHAQEIPPAPECLDGHSPVYVCSRDHCPTTEVPLTEDPTGDDFGNGATTTIAPTNAATDPPTDAPLCNKDCWPLRAGKNGVERGEVCFWTDDSHLHVRYEILSGALYALKEVHLNLDSKASATALTTQVDQVVHPFAGNRPPPGQYGIAANTRASPSGSGLQGVMLHQYKVPLSLYSSQRPFTLSFLAHAALADGNTAYAGCVSENVADNAGWWWHCDYVVEVCGV